jgi:hypothetical protein
VPVPDDYGFPGSSVWLQAYEYDPVTGAGGLSGAVVRRFVQQR